MRAPEFWTRTDPLSRLGVAALTPFGWIYGSSVAWRAARATPHRVAAKVICVGNLTAGGSGKTPVAIAIAELLRGLGRRVVFLTRGYGGNSRGPLLVDPRRHCAKDVGDEPLLLAQSAPVVVSRDRKEGADLAVAEGADVIVMDDGHQNFELEKDLSILVVPAADPVGNGRILPAGPLREPVLQGLSRAQAAVVVGDGATPKWLELPSFRARLEPTANDLAGNPVLAFAGIGQPQRFFETLHTIGARLVDTRSFGDHHPYTAAEIARLKSAARSAKARLVTTEKDYVRLTHAEREGIEMLHVRAMFDEPAALTSLLERLSPGAMPAS